VAEEPLASIGSTALFVELVVIGTGGLLAGAVMFDAVAGTHLVADSRDSSTAATAALVALAYAVGVVLDRVADAAGEPLSRRWRRRSFPDASDDQDYERALLQVLSTPAYERRLAYGRSRLRVCRGGVLDGLLLIVAVLVQAVAGPHGGWRLLASEVGFAAIFVVACLFAWKRLAQAQYEHVARQGAG
jgi:hypothetical protein